MKPAGFRPILTSLLTITLLMFHRGGFAADAPGVTPDGKESKKSAKGTPFEQVIDNPKLPRVLLIGDSISIGYTVPVRNLLKEKANVHRIGENGGPTTNGLAKLSKWLGHEKWDVIHFNWGLHDLKFMPEGKRQVDPELYEKNLRQLVRELRATGAKLIWASTTPAPAEEVKPPRKNADVLAYNEIASKIMRENQVVVDDLYAVAAPHLKGIQLPANVHFNAEGYALLAKQVAASIGASLARKD